MNKNKEQEEGGGGRRDEKNGVVVDAPFFSYSVKKKRATDFFLTDTRNTYHKAVAYVVVSLFVKRHRPDVVLFLTYTACANFNRAPYTLPYAKYKLDPYFRKLNIPKPRKME